MPFDDDSSEAYFETVIRRMTKNDMIRRLEEGGLDGFERIRIERAIWNIDHPTNRDGSEQNQMEVSRYR